jgi:hypothetical protein
MNKEDFIRPEDQEMFASELDSFVPDQVFDAHAHLCHPDFLDILIKGLPKIFGSDEFAYWIDCLHPGRKLGACFLPFIWPYPKNASFSKCNEWIAENARNSGNFRAAFFVRPQDDPEWVRQEVRRLGCRCLKCYFTAAQVADPWNAEIPDYFPESLACVANQEGWAITVHLVKSRAVGDPGNIHWLQRYCREYPNMKIILAHSARGFQPANNLEGLQHLTGCDNLFFDSSANCESFAHEVVLKLFGHKKLLYGSDSPICSLLRGRNFGIGTGFIWVSEESNGDLWQTGQPNSGKPILLGLEHLRSLKWAAWSAGLTDSQVEDMFWNNAAALF